MYLVNNVEKNNFQINNTKLFFDTSRDKIESLNKRLKSDELAKCARVYLSNKKIQEYSRGATEILNASNVKEEEVTQMINNYNERFCC